MAKKQAQFRFEEDFYSKIMEIANADGVTVSEVVRSALGVYASLHGRLKEKGARLYIEYEGGRKPKCEVVLPWIS